jgi:hypothetical protein
MVEVPDFIQRRRVARAVAALDASHDPGWFFREVPADRLAQFERDLLALVNEVKASGARVILLTHATAFGSGIEPDELSQITAWRQLVGRPTGEVLVHFEVEARRATLRVAARSDAQVVDLASAIDGRKDLFASDGLHFNDAGAARVAALVADAITDGRGAGWAGARAEVHPNRRP